MRNKKQELNDILSKYDPAVQKVYQKVLSQENIGVQGVQTR